MFEHCTGYNVLDVLGRNWCARGAALALLHLCLTPARASRFLQYRGAYATARHPLVDTAVTSRLREAVTKVRLCPLFLAATFGCLFRLARRRAAGAPSRPDAHLLVAVPPVPGGARWRGALSGAAWPAQPASSAKPPRQPPN